MGRRTFPALIGVLIAGCAMVDSAPINLRSNLGCTTELGAYYLPKSLVTLTIHPMVSKEVTGGRVDPNPDNWEDIEGQFAAVAKRRTKADRERGYCLDYLASATSDDRILVDRTPEGLLNRVASQADDQTDEIIGTLLDTLFVLASGNPAFDRKMTTAQVRAGAGKKEYIVEPDLTTTLLRTDYDPADENQAGVVNQRIRDFGLCVVLQPDACPPQKDAYCGSPHASGWDAAYVRSNGNELEFGGSNRHSDIFRRDVNGIHYRVRQPHNFCIYEQGGEKGPGNWKLREQVLVKIENLSPIFSVNVDRTIFARRTAELKFETGRLQSIEINKGSELLEFVQIPLQIAESVVALPANIIQVRVDVQTTRAEIAAAESSLAAEQIKEMRAMRALEQAQKGGGS